jgi:hypothetical protein
MIEYFPSSAPESRRTLTGRAACRSSLRDYKKEKRNKEKTLLKKLMFNYFSLLRLSAFFYHIIYMKKL